MTQPESGSSDGAADEDDSPPSPRWEERRPADVRPAPAKSTSLRSKESPRICVLGSLNMDLVVRCPHLPKRGETVLGGPFAAFAGGKGANQAVAAARAGAAVSLIGCVGRDLHGRDLLDGLRRAAVDVDGVRVRADAPTGVALISVDAAGENTIVVAPGCNDLVDAAVVEESSATISRASVLLMQLEVSMAAVTRAAEIARRAGVKVVLSAAPARELSQSLLRCVDVLIANRGEAVQLSGVDSDEDVATIALALRELYDGAAVLTCGAEGAVWADHDRVCRQPGFAVPVVDTVGAGDAFSGALAVALAEARPPAEALRFACAAGALATTRVGAQPSLPQRGEIEALVG
jgi:ribokinase